MSNSAVIKNKTLNNNHLVMATQPVAQWRNALGLFSQNEVTLN